MQTIRSTRNCLETQLASGTPAVVGVSTLFGSGFTGLAPGANLWPKAMGLSGMQCSGGRISVPGDDV
mgnify:CR=1 FL=1